MIVDQSTVTMRRNFVEQTVFHERDFVEKKVYEKPSLIMRGNFAEVTAGGGHVNSEFVGWRV
jgi:hypothetical protein